MKKIKSLIQDLYLLFFCYCAGVVCLSLILISFWLISYVVSYPEYINFSKKLIILIFKGGGIMGLILFGGQMYSKYFEKNKKLKK